MRLRERLKIAVKAFNGGYDWVDSSLPGNVFSNATKRSYYRTGTSINWDAVTGDFTQNAAAMACYSWLCKNIAQAPPQVVTMQNGEEIAKPRNWLVKLLNAPNDYYDGHILQDALVLSLWADGNAYVGVERNGIGQPNGLVWLAHNRVKMKRDNNSTEPFDYYEFQQERGQVVRYEKDQIIHLRIGIDPADPLLGLSPFKALKQSQYTLDQSVNYTANLMRNFGNAGIIITPKNPEQIFDPQEVTDKWNSKTQRDGAGATMALDIPIDIEYPKNSPQDLAIETLQDRPESDICAVLGVPPQVAGCHVGRLSKTYANMKEAREMAWEETVLPMLNLIASQLTQWFRQYELLNMSDRISYDVSSIRPLQPDLDALHKRSRENWMRNLITREQWKMAVGMIPEAEDVGLYYQDTLPVTAPTTPISGEGTNSNGT